MGARRALKIVLLATATLVLLAGGALYVLLETRWGMERVRRFAETLVNDRIPGEMRIGRLNGPGLLGGLSAYDIVVTGPAGATVITADSARASYDWRSFVRRRPVLDGVRIWGADILVAKATGEDAFGIERAFVAASATDTVETSGTPIEIRDAALFDARVVVRQAVDPAEDSSPFVIEETPAGPVRVMHFEHLSAKLDRVLVGGSDTRVALDIANASVEGHVLPTPFRVTDLRGRVTLRDSTLHLDLPDIRLPSSRSGAEGTVTLGQEALRVEIAIDARDVALADLGWINPRVPAEGTVAGQMTVRLDSLGTELRASELRAAFEGTRVTGDGGIRTGDPLRLLAVDLRLEPLALAQVESWLGRELPVEGAITGRFVADGALDRLTTRGDLQVQPRGAVSPARFRWSGTAGAVADPVVRNMDVEIESLDAAVVADFVDGLELSGRVDAHLVANGPLSRGIEVDGTVTHRTPTGAVSQIGTVGSLGRNGGGTHLDLDLELRPLQLAVLAPFGDALTDIQGEATGRVRLSGPVDDLTIDAVLRSPAGGIASAVRITGTAERGFAGSLSLDRFRPALILPGLPTAGATGTVTFDVLGTEPATMSGTIVASLDSASFDRYELGPIEAAVHIADGVVHVDTLVADAPGSVLRAEGEFGLAHGASGRIEGHLTVSSLQPLERFVFTEESPDPTVPRLDGHGTASVTIDGSIHSFAVTGAGRLENLVWNAERLWGIDATVEGSGLGGEGGRLELLARADSAAVMGHEADSARVHAVLAGGDIEVDAYAGYRGRDKVDLEATIVRTDSALVARVASLRFDAGTAAWQLASPARITIAGPVIAVDSVALVQAGDGGRFEADGRILRITEDQVTPSEPLDFSARLTDIPLGEVVRFAGIDLETTGTLDGSLRLTGTAAAPTIDGDLVLRDFALDDAALDTLVARVDYADRRVEVRTEGFRDGRRVLFADGRVPVDLRIGPVAERRLAESLDLSFQADSMPARFMLGFVDALGDVEGLVDGQVAATGTTRDPELTGALSVRRGAATMAVLGVRYRNVGGTLRFQQGTSVAVDLAARAAPAARPNDVEGSFRVTGLVDIGDVLNPSFDLDIEAQGLIAANRRDVAVTTTGNVHLDGTYQAPRLRGDIRIDGGTVNIDEVYRQYLVVGLEDPLLFDVVDTSLVAVKRVLPESENPFIRNLQLEDFNVAVGAGSWMRSREMNVEVTGDLNVVFNRQTEDLRLTGTLNTVRGTYRLEYPGVARVFEVREGTVEFPGTPGVNPNLNVRALHRVRTQDEPLDIYAVVGGTLENPRVSLTSASDVAYSESDLASYLFFGVPSYALGSGAGNNSALTGILGSGAFGYLSASLQSLAQSVGLVDYIGVSAAQSTLGGAESGGFGNLVENTQIELGRYITPDVFLIWTQRLGGDTSTPDIRVEWRLTDAFTAELYFEDRFARTPSFGLRQIASARKVVGFFLFREWGY